MNNDIQNFSSRERGLLSVASQHKGSVAFYENTVVPHLEATLVKAWMKHARFFSEEDVEDIWNYIQEAKWNTYVKIDSAKIGVLTTLEPYTNKKGETKPAHFTHNGTYLGSIKQLGDKPISYVGNFRITKEHFEVYYPAYPANPKRVADFFRPKEIAVCCSEEVPAPRKKPVLIDDDNDEPIPEPVVIRKKVVIIYTPEQIVKQEKALVKEELTALTEFNIWTVQFRKTYYCVNVKYKTGLAHPNHYANLTAEQQARLEGVIANLNLTYPVKIIGDGQ